MKLTDIVLEANVAAKIVKDPKLTKMLSIAFRHDDTLPGNVIAKLGPKPTDVDIVKTWSDLIDKSLFATNFGDLSREGKFDDWLARQYINGVVNYEDINGEGGDSLGTWQALSTRGKLQPQDQDFNKFKSIHQLQMAMRKPIYSNEIDRMKKAEEIEKHKRTKKDVVIVDNERYFAIIPMNYGACYTFAHAAGYKPNFCTSSSSGLEWFKRYAPNGMIVSITDKANQDEANGKWQFHAQTHQLVNGDQDRRHDVQWNDDRFSKMFPGLMKQIVAGIEAKAEEINQASQDVTHGGYDVAKEVQDIKTTYPLSYASVEQGAEPAADDQPRGQELY